ncbi:MAG: septum formation protein Maf [Chlorobiota bacterium]|jgi:septum formation protein|nr:septum formation protein Maf [Chlorobiota bacterium]QQS66951.1 MAG: septum formation protein Maf [Chlorobiota bacterium]
MLQKIILASGSPRRMQLLKQIGIVFEVEIPQSDESIIVGESPSELVMRLSKLKATEIANKLVTGIIIGSDTIVVLEGDVLGKPINKLDAISMLKRLSNKTHKVFTGYSIIDVVNKVTITNFNETEVKFRNLDENEIFQYVESGSPLDKAGSYGIQDDFGAVFIEYIIGDYYTVVGLPISKLYLDLKKINAI